MMTINEQGKLCEPLAKLGYRGKWSQFSKITASESNVRINDLSVLSVKGDKNKIKIRSNKENFDFKVDEISAFIEKLIKEFAESISKTKINSYREKDLRWLQNNLSMLQKYKEEWICIENQKIILHANELKEVIDKAKRKGIGRPFCFYVTKHIDNNFIGM